MVPSLIRRLLCHYIVEIRLLQNKSSSVDLYSDP